MFPNWWLKIDLRNCLARQHLFDNLKGELISVLNLILPCTSLRLDLVQFFLKFIGHPLHFSWRCAPKASVIVKRKLRIENALEL